MLEDRLRLLPAFHALQQVVRVDPQIMLVLNTEVMRFEDPKSGQMGQEGNAAEVTHEREAVEAALLQVLRQRVGRVEGENVVDLMMRWLRWPRPF